MKRAIVIALSVLLALLVAVPMAFGHVRARRAGVKGVRQDRRVGRRLDAVGVFETRRREPLIGSYKGGEQCDGTPVSPTPGKTWFLAGTTNGEKVKRTCTVPVGTKLFFPVVSATFFITNPPEENKQVARDYVKDFIKAVEEDPDLSIEVKVDGKEISSNRIVRAKTDFFKVTFPQDNIFAEFGVKAGKYQTFSNGLWVTLPPLSKGEHKIHWEVNAPNVDLDPNTPGPEGFSQNNTYHLKVVNSRQT